MGKGTTTVTPQIPPELSGLYSQTANRIMQGQNVLPLFGGAGTATPRQPQGPKEPEDELRHPRNRRADNRSVLR